MFTWTTTTTRNLRQAERATGDISEVNLRLKLRWHYAYGCTRYTVVNQF